MARPKKATAVEYELIRRGRKTYIKSRQDFSGWVLVDRSGKVTHLLPLENGCSRGRIAAELGVPKVWRRGSLVFPQLPRKVLAWTHELVRVCKVRTCRYHLVGSEQTGWTLLRSGAKNPLIWRGRSGPWMVYVSAGVRAGTAEELCHLLGFDLIEVAPKTVGPAPACPEWMLLARRDSKVSRKAALGAERDRLNLLPAADWAAHLQGAA